MILYYVGRLILGIGFTMVIPLLVALISFEWDPALDFVIGMSATIAVGYLLLIICRTGRDPGWGHGVLVVPLAWLAAMVLGAIPLYLSGHFASFLNAMFDAMSGFAPTGLTIIQDLDHLSYSHNFWRHLMLFIGGQGIVVVTLTLMTSGAAGVYGMYVGEAREEKILPNLIHTARIIWLVSFVYLGIGTFTLWAAGWYIGMPPLRALYHGITIFMSAFSTGGFTPQSQSIIYYHSALYEIATIPIMIAGALNFAIHYALFKGNRKEILRNSEIITLTTTTIITFTLVTIAIVQAGAYLEVGPLFRRSFYQLISAHTGTGFVTTYGQLLPNLWGQLAILCMLVAMGLGGSAGSTAGGIKALRILAIAKAFKLEMRRLLLPPSAVIVESYHHLKKNHVTEKLLFNAFIISLAYIATFLVGSIIGVFYGYSFFDAMFESVSATANVGLTSGVTSPSMPDALKVVYIIQMWAGRLEFISIIALIGFAVSVVRGK